MDTVGLTTTVSKNLRNDRIKREPVQQLIQKITEFGEEKEFKDICDKLVVILMNCSSAPFEPNKNGITLVSKDIFKIVLDLKLKSQFGEQDINLIFSLCYV